MYITSTLSAAQCYLPAIPRVNSVNNYLNCSFKTETKPSNPTKRSPNNVYACLN